MTFRLENHFRIVPTVHGKHEVGPDPAFEIDLSRHLGASYSRGTLIEQLDGLRTRMVSWIASCAGRSGELLLKRAFQRGRVALRHPSGRLGKIAKAVVAVPCYSLSLPFFPCSGHHVFHEVFGGAL
jgi:hypothetical protein